ncbi:MAG TPA: alcohol dehydrogenase catalytic domain-containing protein [Candidatus Acidoferrales bacterium]|nr:alcohol dehydrogenase catalytic domain-containing protein [Candidatus Acidoferrales bacterium]
MRKLRRHVRLQLDRSFEHNFTRGHGSPCPLFLWFPSRTGFSLSGFKLQVHRKGDRLKPVLLARQRSLCSNVFLMLAVVTRRKYLAVVQKPLPRLRPGWAQVHVRLAGICNTDIEILRGYHNFSGTLGHEFVGEVERVASPGDKKWIGQRVVGEINLACSGLRIRRKCSYCRRGIPMQCAHRRVLGILGHDGAFAEYLALPVVNLHRVPKEIPDEAAVFTEPLAAACEILEQVDVRAHREAAVIGDGKLAQLVARGLRTSGLRVVMIGKHENKLRLARLAGIATAKITSLKSRRENAFTLTVEATGSPSGLALAQQITVPRGTLVLKSTFHGPANVETWPIVVKELTVIGSRCGPFPRALTLLRSGRVDPRPLISRFFELKDAAKAIRYAQQPGVMKVLLRPDPEHNRNDREDQ